MERIKHFITGEWKTFLGISLLVGVVYGILALGGAPPLTPPAVYGVNVVPGERLGAVHLGMTPDEVKAALGTKTSEDEIELGIQRWFYPEAGIAVYFSDGSVTGIRARFKAPPKDFDAQLEDPIALMKGDMKPFGEMIFPKGDGFPNNTRQASRMLKKSKQTRNFDDQVQWGFYPGAILISIKEETAFIPHEIIIVPLPIKPPKPS